MYLSNLNGFPQQRFKSKMNICILPPYDSISSTIFNLNCRLKSCSPKWPHAEFNRGLLSPFYNIQKRIMHQFSLFLPQNHHEFIQCDPEALFVLTIHTYEDYPRFSMVPPWQNIILIHVIEVFDVKRGLCLAYSKSKRYRHENKKRVLWRSGGI